MRLRLFCVVTLVLSSVGCWNPLSPGETDGANDQFNWTVDGQSFQATRNGRGALRAGGTVTLTGANCNSGASLSILLRNPTVGTQMVGNDLSVSWTPDARTSQAAGTSWEAGPAGRGSGSVTIGSLSNDRVSGSFTVEMPPGSGSPVAGNKSLQGTFDLSFHDSTIC